MNFHIFIFYFLALALSLSHRMLYSTLKLRMKWNFPNAIENRNVEARNGWDRKKIHICGNVLASIKTQSFCKLAISNANNCRAKSFIFIFMCFSVDLVASVRVPAATTAAPVSQSTNGSKCKLLYNVL